jgi:AcrR family transcriptional regulator
MRTFVAAGRKKSFNENEALRSAIDVFWAKGYAGASLTDLTKSMGINKPSLYGAFGNKEALFIKATKLYIELRMQVHSEILVEPNMPLGHRLKNYLMAVILNQCESEQPKGCYLVLCQSELISGDIPPLAANFLKEMEEMPKQLFIDIFTNDPESITRKLDLHAYNNALSLYTLLKGTASMARSGISAADLEFVADIVLRGIGFE